MNTFHIRTLGCKVNQCDSQEIRERLSARGWKEKADNSSADVCIVNTCCVTHHADRKSRNAIRGALRLNQYAHVVVTGCYAGYDRPAIEEIKGIDAIFENNRKEELFSWLEALENGDRKSVLSSLPFAGRTRAFLKIQDGCSNRCAYCIVPFVRGPSRSKKMPLVFKEARRLVEAGHQEIVLTGICLGSFGKDLSPKVSLVDLLSELEEIDDLRRIRLSSIEAADVTDRLLKKMASSRKICPHLHIPFQSGDDKVLADMNKRSRTSDYKQIVEKAREHIKDLALTCDFIIGFPTETQENFKNTLSFLKFLMPLKTHIFTYSQRRGVTSFAKKNKSSCDAIRSRFNTFKKLSDELSLEFKSGFLRKNLSVLLEEESESFWKGYAENYIKVWVDSHPSFRNALVRVKVSDLYSDGLKGKIA